MRELAFIPKDRHQGTPSLLSCRCSSGYFHQDLTALCKLPQTQSTAFGLHGRPWHRLYVSDSGDTPIINTTAPGPKRFYEWQKLTLLPP